MGTVELKIKPNSVVQNSSQDFEKIFGNDPSAGSPTDTLLRLLLPLSDMVYLTSHLRLKELGSPEGSPNHSKSVGATGGVYKGQGRNQHKLMTYAY
jgi:hypothetical protein